MSQASWFDRTTALPNIETLTGDAGGAVGPTPAGNLNIQGGSNINTAGFPGANMIQINLDDTVNIIGSMTAGTGFVATSGGVQVIDGDVTLSSGRVLLPDTSAGFLDGTINFGGDVYLHNFGVDNFFVGPNSGNDTLTGTDNFNIGSNSLENLTSGSHNVAIGNNVLNAVTSGGYNTAIAPSALASLTTGNYNTVYGREGGAFLINGISNLILGYQSGISYTTNESSNLIIGNAGVIGDDNTIRIGTPGAGSHQQEKTYIAHCYSNYGTKNAFVGNHSGNTTMTIATSYSNAALGDTTLINLVSGQQNTACGAESLQQCTSGDNNTACGYAAVTNLTIGVHNTGIGNGSLAFLDTGGYNTCLGTTAGFAYTTNESSNICIRNAGVIGESNTLRIGTTGAGNGQQNKAYLAGTYGVIPAAATQQVVMDANEQLGTSGAFTITGTVTTIGAVTGDAITIALGAIPLTASLDVTVAAFEATTPAGAFYKLWNGARTTGAAAALTGTTDNVVNEEAALLAADADIIVNANNVIIRVTGVALLTINWKATVNYITVA